MARETITRLIDDIDGGKAEETVKFALDGVDYEIDLSGKNAKKLRGELAAYVEKGQRLKREYGKRAPGRVPGSRSARSDLSTAVREWADREGIPVGRKGRIRQDIVDQYHRATEGSVAAAQRPVKTIPAKAAPKTVRAPKAQQIKGSVAEKKDLLQQVRTWAKNQSMPEIADSLTVASLSEALVDAYSEDNRRAFEDAFKALTTTVKFSSRR